MYREHVPQIAAAMRADPRIFARGIMLAILSARTQFVRIGDQMSDLEERGADSAGLWGWKFDAYSYLGEHTGALWEHVRNGRTPGGAIADLCRVPGLGIVKAGFVCQLMGFDVGCLDTRNIDRLGLLPRAYRSDGEERKRKPAFQRKIARYVAEVGGRAEVLWNDWCNDAAKTYATSGDEISRAHLAIIPKDKRRTYARHREEMPCILCPSDIPL